MKLSFGTSINPGFKKARNFHYGYVVLFFGILIIIGSLGFARFGYTIILPSMQSSLNFNNSLMGIIGTANLLGYVVFSPICGLLSAKYGPRLLIICSMLLIGTTMVLTGLTSLFVLILFLRFLSGMGSAGSNISTMGLISAWFGPKRRGMAMGFLFAGSGIGVIITGFLVPWLVLAWPQNGWRISWCLLGVLAGIFGLLGYMFLWNKPIEKGLCPVGETLNAIEVQSINKIERNKIQIRQVYQLKVLWHLGLVYFLFGLSYIIFMTFFPATLINDKGYTQAAAGTLLALSGFISIPSSVLWGATSDYLNRKYALALALVLSGISYALVAKGNSLPAMYLAALLKGLSTGGTAAIVLAMSGDYVGYVLAPVAVGMMTVFLGMGQVLGPIAGGYLADITGSLSTAFLVAAGLAVLGSINAIFLKFSG